MSDTDLEATEGVTDLDQEVEEESDFASLSDEEFLKRLDEVPSDVQAEEAPGHKDEEDSPTVIGDTGEELDSEEAVAETNPASAQEQDPNQPQAQKPASEAEGKVDYQALYNQVMGPIKANGQTFTPASPEEAVRLMQMGANYTKKMQAMQPHLKLLRTLDRHGLLSEEKVNYLIDLTENNPQAIQKLLKDGKIDPLDLDTNAEDTYKPGNHLVSDAEMVFDDAVNSVAETAHGKETIQHINQTWDQASKRHIYEEPALLAVIDKQRSNGIYAKITAEMERRKVLGELGNLPFIQAYRTVGDDLHRKGLLAPSGQAPASAAPAPAPSPLVRNTRPAQPRSPAASREQVRAVSAAPSATPRSTKFPTDFDPLSLTDEEFLAIFNKR